MQASASPAVKGTFPVRMLRWVAVSPDGKRVAYQALGYIYVRDLPNGTPQRLTTQTDHFEYYPSWSRDSKSIVYTTWNDEKLGHGPRRVRSRRRPRVVTDKPGHYLEPVFSPDGTRIVYRRRPAASCARRAGPPSPASTSSPAAGGKPTLVIEDGFAPHFGKASDRVFFVKTEGGGDQIAPEKRVFASIELDGSDAHEYYLSELAQEFAISPDGKWLAFREGFNAYVTPFVATGRRSTSAPRARPSP